MPATGCSERFEFSATAWRMICNAIMERLPSGIEAGSQKRQLQTHPDGDGLRTNTLIAILKPMMSKFREG
jgi:hypothetical protein